MFTDVAAVLADAPEVQQGLWVWTVGYLQRASDITDRSDDPHVQDLMAEVSGLIRAKQGPIGLQATGATPVTRQDLADAAQAFPPLADWMRCLLRALGAVLDLAEKSFLPDVVMEGIREIRVRIREDWKALGL